MYQEIVNKNKPHEPKLKNLIISFVAGGFIGLLGEFLTDLYGFLFSITRQDAITIMLITLIFIASLFTALGFFDNLVSFCKCGLIIPITGFSHSLTSSCLEYKTEGMISGIGSNTFKLAGSVIVYGVVSAIIFGLIRIILGG